MNVKTTFLNGDLYEDVYKDQLVGFKENVIDQCIYMKNSGSKFVILILYVDDILFGFVIIWILYLRPSRC